MPLLVLLSCRSADLIQALQHPQILYNPSTFSRKRKRGQEEQDAGHRSPPAQGQLPSTQLRTKPSSYTAENELHTEAATDISENGVDPLGYWIQTGKWHKDYFEQDSQVREDFERGKSPEPSEQMDLQPDFHTKEPIRPMHGFHHLQHLFARKRSSASLRRKNSESSLRTPSDQLPREVKSAPYRTLEYEAGLEKKGSYMCKFKDGCKHEHLEGLLYSEQTVPRDSLFRDDLFDKTCENIRNRNEAMVIRDIGSLIVPSAQTLATYGATHLNPLFECVNEGWNSAVPFYGTRPQPDYSVGFGRSAFTEEQSEKLEPFAGEIGSKDFTYFMATTRMYFPFLTCEVKCGAAALDVADRQNAHSMTIAVKGIVELYRAVRREKELHREILAFSISHDDSSVRIYGHYALIEGVKTTFYRETIRRFDFTEQNGKEKWSAYTFTKNVYDIWMPIHLKRICSAIDDLPPDVDFGLSQSASFPEEVESQSSQQFNAGSTSMLGEEDSQSSLVASQDTTPDTSFAQRSEREHKKPKTNRT